MESRFARIFGAGTKPVIAMAHLPALPGHAAARRRGRACRAWSTPSRATSRSCSTRASTPSCSATRTTGPTGSTRRWPTPPRWPRVVTELAPRDRPFGVDYLWDARCALAVAATTGASFIREVMPGVFESDMGLWRPDPASLLRERRTLGADDVAVLMNVTPEFASPLGTRPAGMRARSAVVSTLADAILVSGPMAGSEPDLEAVREVVDAVAGAAPVLLNTGAKAAQHRRVPAARRRRASSAPTSSSTAARGTRSTATACAASWPRPTTPADDAARPRRRHHGAEGRRCSTPRAASSRPSRAATRRPRRGPSYSEADPRDWLARRDRDRARGVRARPASRPAT